jgi:DNA polymerase eta
MNLADAFSHWTTAVHEQQHHRVVLLLDLDCFYAQCECVRLGLNARTTPLALMQWDSVLAVTYPARELYDIQRGDPYETIRNKQQSSVVVTTNTTTTTTTTAISAASDRQEKESSASSSSSEKQQAGGRSIITNVYQKDSSRNTATAAGCYTVHVPILTTRSSSRNGTVSAADTLNDDDYFTIFRLTADQQEQARRDDLGVKRNASEGKACIERYRVASARIFHTVLEWIQQAGYSPQEVILERASIDEFFLDVTGACRRTMVDDIGQIADAVLHTVAVGPPSDPSDALRCERSPDKNDDDDDDDDIRTMLERGCWIAQSIRKAVLDKLGFTLSAGISVNKSLAKLSTTYGKPDGQAVTFPRAIEYLLNRTPIRKCRNFGGKLGAKVKALLPPDVPTVVGSIAKYLSLPLLEKGLDDAETARWVYDVSRGIDNEAVVAKNESALTKSITAFKSLPFQKQGYSLEEAASWIRLLAQDVVTRVTKDATRINRYPRRCTIHYGAGQYQGKSVRMLFPPERSSMEEKVNTLVQQVLKLLQTKEGAGFRLNRIGLCAVEFVSRETGIQAIDHYFSAKKDESVEQSQSFVSSTISQQLVSSSNPKKRNEPSSVRTTEDTDTELAKKLQAGFDREHRLFEALERKRISKPTTTKRIDSFFQKR